MSTTHHIGPVSYFAFAAAFVGMLFVHDIARAASLGQVAAPNGGCANCDVIQLSTDPSSPSYKVPPGQWTITSWSAGGGGVAAGKARLRVYRPTGTQGQYQFFKQSALEKVKKLGHPVFSTNLAVKGDDMLGILTVSNVGGAADSLMADDISGIITCETSTLGTLIGEGTDCTIATLANHRTNIKVTLARRH